MSLGKLEARTPFFIVICVLSAVQLPISSNSVSLRLERLTATSQHQDRRAITRVSWVTARRER